LNVFVHSLDSWGEEQAYEYCVMPPVQNEREQTVRSATPPSTNFMLVGSMPIDPEQYTMPLHLIACEKNGIGAGALVVRTDSLRVMASESSW